MWLNMLTEMTTGVSLLIAVIFIIRKIFNEKLNPNVRYFLWAFVALRILLPFNMELSLPDTGLAEIWKGLFSIPETTVPEEKNEDVLQMMEEPGMPEMPGFREAPGIDTSLPADEIYIDRDAVKKVEISMEYFIYITWFSGMACMAGYVAVNNVRLHVIVRKKRTQTGILLKKIPVYELTGYNCLLGHS